MFDNIGLGELLVIGLFILIFFGPKKIPDIARSLGKAVREFRKAMQDVQSEIQNVTGIDLNSDLDFTTSQNEQKNIPSELDDLKFSKEDVKSTEPGAVFVDEKLSKNNQGRKLVKKKTRGSNHKNKSRSRVKTKSKKR
ncbi:MAG: twin-arginine translocase TatA/TatE family subunit [Candidatus Kryptonium sp.]